MRVQSTEKGVTDPILTNTVLEGNILVRKARLVPVCAEINSKVQKITQFTHVSLYTLIL